MGTEAYRGLRVTVLAGAVASLLGGVPAAYGQQSQRTADDALEEITVTGTRIRRDDFTTPNATTVMSRVEMDNLGIVNVADMITQLPGNVSNFSLETTGESPFGVGAAIANMRGMNTFFGTRTLTLVDSRRFVSSNNGGSVDLNVIPSAMVGRIESVTGGASASYGADAVSGVINILLDTDLEGFRIRSDYGTTQKGDGDNYSISIAGGTSLFDNRGHVTLSFERQDQDAIRNCAAARDWCAQSWGSFSQGGDGFFTPALTKIENPIFPGEPGILFMGDRRSSTSPNGTLHSNIEGQPWYQFNDAGNALLPWDPGQLAYRGATSTVFGGQGRLLTDRVGLRPNSLRDSFFGNFKFDVTDRIEFSAEATYSTSESLNIQASPGQMRQNLCIEMDNGFLQKLPQDVRDTMLAQPQATNSLGINSACSSAPPQFASFFENKHGLGLTKDWGDQISRNVTTDTETRRVVVGLNMDLWENWTLDTYFQYGNTNRSQTATNYYTVARQAMALDSVLADPNDPNSDVICRVHAQDERGAYIKDRWYEFWDPDLADEYFETLSAGCVPLNPFGKAASAEALGYYFGDLTEFNTIYQRVLSTSLSGPIANGWGAGSIQMAAGLDYRYDYTRNDAGSLPRVLRTDFSAQYGDPWAGEVEGIEVFTEFELPLLRDKTAAKYLMLNLAGRRTEQSARPKDEREGASYKQRPESWKVSLVWDPIDWMRVRATRSSDVRAPSIRELFYRQTQPAGGFGGGASVTNRWVEQYNNDHGTDYDDSDTGEWIVGANPNLENETSITETLGFVFSPGGRLEGFRFAVDFFQTALIGGISYLGPQDTIDGCFYDNRPEFCAALEFAGDALIPGMTESNLLRWESLQMNLQPFTTKGYDFTANYTFQLGGGGGLAMRLLATHMDEQIIDTFGTQLNVAGQTGGNTGFLPNYTPTPEWAGNMFWTYYKNAFTATVQAIYTGSGHMNLQNGWVAPGDPGWAPELTQTVPYNRLPSWTTWNMTLQYDFAQSRFAPARFEELAAYLRVDNVMDKDPIFSNGGVGGVNAMFFPTLGRTFQLGLRMQF